MDVDWGEFVAWSLLGSVVGAVLFGGGTGALLGLIGGQAGFLLFYNRPR